MPAGQLQVGQLCAARYSGTGEWHRAYIIDTLINHVQVVFSFTADKYISGCVCLGFVVPLGLVVFIFLHHVGPGSLHGCFGLRVVFVSSYV